MLLVSFLIENWIILCPSGLNKYTSTQLSGRMCDYNAEGPGYDFPMPQKKKQTAPIITIYIAMFS